VHGCAELPSPLATRVVERLLGPTDGHEGVTGTQGNAWPKGGKEYMTYSLGIEVDEHTLAFLMRVRCCLIIMAIMSTTRIIFSSAKPTEKN
jgi:hypothetical protein